MEQDKLTKAERELRFRNRQLAKCSGKQGQTIHLLRAELAEVRELGSKIERGELRRLQRFEVSAKEQFALDAVRQEKAREEIQGLRETVEKLESELDDLASGE